MPDEYRALREKVDAFVQQARETSADALHCRAGCDACCHVWLTVSSVEADVIAEHLTSLDSVTRARVKARGERELSREAQGPTAPRCAMLEDDGRCAVYDARPLVCRTQGHALRYPSESLPEGTVRLRLSDGEVTHCPLNYAERAPRGREVLDAERMDRLLAVVGHRHAQRHAISPLNRYSLSALAAIPFVLASRERVDEDTPERKASDDDPRGR